MSRSPFGPERDPRPPEASGSAPRPRPASFEPDPSPADVEQALRWAGLALAALYGGWLVFAYRFHFVDFVNLAIHETGHILFTPFGETAHFLGGTILQVAFPLAFAVHFWRQRDLLAAGACTIWMGGSLMYTAEYMADAQAMVLPLVGGGVHDWNHLFGHWGILHRAEGIARLVHVVGTVVVVASLVVMLDDTLRRQKAANAGDAPARTGPPTA